MRVRDRRGNLIANVPTAWLQKRLRELKAAGEKLSRRTLRTLTWEYLEPTASDLFFLLRELKAIPELRVSEIEALRENGRWVDPLPSLEDHDLLDDSTEEQTL